MKRKTALAGQGAVPVGKWRRLRFKEALSPESCDELCNPACGWYSMITVYADREPDFSSFDWSIGAQDTLALVMIHIGAYKDRPLDVEALSRIGAVFSYFRRRGVQMILRVVYDNEGNGLLHEPETFAQVLSHIGQLAPLLRGYAAEIFVFQGLLLGSWGEMHHSRYLGRERLMQLERALREGIGSGYLAVRRPVFYRQMLPRIRKEAAIGIFDDGICGSETDLGTFGEGTRNTQGWTGAWNREEELCFMDELGRFSPCGGEAVFWERQNRQPEKLAEDFSRMHLTYLNRSYDERILSEWKQMNWKKGGVWKHTPFYDYVGRHLGYRFLVTGTAFWGTNLAVQIKNTGFAPCYEPVYVSARIGADTVVTAKESLEGLCGQEEITCTFPLPPEGVHGCVSLSAARSSDGRRISFANAADDHRIIFIGEIL